MAVRVLMGIAPHDTLLFARLLTRLTYEDGLPALHYHAFYKAAREMLFDPQVRVFVAEGNGDSRSVTGHDARLAPSEADPRHEVDCPVLAAAVVECLPLHQNKGVHAHILHGWRAPGSARIHRAQLLSAVCGHLQEKAACFVSFGGRRAHPLSRFFTRRGGVETQATRTIIVEGDYRYGVLQRNR